MSRGSRFSTFFLLLGTILAAPSAGAEEKAAGQWTDPPAKVSTPAMNAAATKPAATPAKIEEPKVSARSEARPSRRAAKARPERVRTATSRARPIRQARVEVSRKVESRPSRRVVARMMPPPRTVRATGRSLSPVYGYIAPDAPAEAYYEQRRVGTVGNRPGELGLPLDGGPAYRTVGMRRDGHLIMRWRGPGVSTGLVSSQPSPFD
ncbi:hypothetical protein [Methylorubrum extorquens]|jgi:hypothetical protein|uniref:Uncharacterized protein n=2 Tax=Methylorubrum extorquens TaxID=408 RepID=C5AWX3_METEA|nr:hypothetical protein [Methylorubrum extorquens]ACS40978.1 hypothetical protein; putative exported protein [Methylorubrum extorquens AM1]EHP92495.1 hypothetical protein MetexDRAFT_2617 [Methylorubrum extorquens DSM 13060]MCP1540865.1 hypothetical protein [Methylorubrum extorquens]MCP1586598.1 hypothetical protein [Methylorubrum extorquens]